MVNDGRVNFADGEWEKRAGEGSKTRDRQDKVQTNRTRARVLLNRSPIRSHSSPTYRIDSQV